MSITELLAIIKQICANDKGVTVMEYGMIAAAVIVAIATVLTTIGAKLRNSFSNVSSDFTS